MMYFWLGLDIHGNNTKQIYNNISQISYGVTWHSFDLTLYNQATTRKRLLTQGSTTTETIDFETSQNLMILTDVNKTHKNDITYPSDFVPPGIKNTTFDLQSDAYFCKTEELSTGHTKPFSFTPEPLPPNYVWEILPINTFYENTRKMFPARQHTTAAQNYDLPLTHFPGRSFASTHYQQQPHPLPHIELHCPHISSEAGYMKFIYRTRWDFSVSYTLHTKPSALSETSYNKFITPYPEAKILSSDTSDGNLPVTFQYLSTPSL
jgi:hypothetical protein